MTALLGKSPIILTTQGDNFGNDGSNWKISTIRFIATGGGQFILTDKSGGRTIAKSGTMSAGETEDVVMDQQWFDGLYLSQTPGGEVHVYYV